MERKVFRGVGAMIISPVSHRRFQIFTKVTQSQALEFDAGRLIEVDLDRTPTRTAWANVQVDDRGISEDRIPLASAAGPDQLDGFHITSIGGWCGLGRPDNLWNGCLIGAVYLEDNYFEHVRRRIDPEGNPWPCDGRRAYQLSSVAYSNAVENGPRKNLRYHGFKARMLARGAGRVRIVELIDAYGLPLGSFSFDFGNPYDVDDAPPIGAGEVALTSDSELGTIGAVFVELAKISFLLLVNPKLPIGLGG